MNTGGIQKPRVIKNYDVIHRFPCSDMWDKEGMSSTFTLPQVLKVPYYLRYSTRYLSRDMTHRF